MKKYIHMKLLAQIINRTDRLYDNINDDIEQSMVLNSTHCSIIPYMTRDEFLDIVSNRENYNLGDIPTIWHNAGSMFIDSMSNFMLPGDTFIGPDDKKQYIKAKNLKYTLFSTLKPYTGEFTDSLGTTIQVIDGIAYQNGKLFNKNLYIDGPNPYGYVDGLFLGREIMTEGCEATVELPLVCNSTDGKTFNIDGEEYTVPYAKYAPIMSLSSIIGTVFNCSRGIYPFLDTNITKSWDDWESRKNIVFLFVEYNGNVYFGYSDFTANEYNEDPFWFGRPQSTFRLLSDVDTFESEILPLLIDLKEE